MAIQKTLITCFIIIHGLTLAGQSRGTLPDVTIVSLDGQEVSTSTLHNEGQPFAISFWATWCRPCLKELNAIDEIYHEWKEYGLKLFAVSIDDPRTRANVLPMVKGRGWEYAFFLDENGDFRRSMGVNNVPHTFIMDGDGNIVYQHTTFSDGMEWEMFDLLLELMDSHD